MKSRIYSYEGKAVTVEYDLLRCIHAGECVRGLPSVFDPKKDPWIKPDEATVENLAEVVSRCPTGALQTRGLVEPTPGTNEVRVIPDGPLYLRGQIALDLGGEEGEREENRVALCRCGASKNKPLCDGAHEKAGFSDPAVVRESKMKEGEVAVSSVRITPAKDGPLLCEGPMTLHTEATSLSGTRTAFCRCGASKNKPFCDGSHREIGFNS